MLMGQQSELLVSGPAVKPGIYQATVFSSGAALALVVWDALLTLDDEVDNIWMGSVRAYVKWIYLFSRWFGLLNQVCFQIWLFFLAVHDPVPTSTYTILVLRIWAVYQRRHRYIAAALAIVFIETLMSITTQAISVPKSTVDGTCKMLHMPEATTCLGVGMMVAQSVLLSLTYRGKALLQPAARRSKLIAVVWRDGTLVFGVVIGILLMSFLSLLFNQVFISVFWPWMSVVPSLLTPRIILNMQMAAEPTETILQFTTHLGNIPNNGMQLPTVRGDGNYE